MAKTNRQQLLLKERDELQQKIHSLEQTIQKTEEEKLKVQNRLGKVKQKIASQGLVREIVITEHALLRYLQREEGVDLKPIQEALLSPELQKQVDVLGGNGKFPIGKGQVVLQNYKIVTFIIPGLDDDPKVSNLSGVLGRPQPGREPDVH